MKQVVPLMAYVNFHMLQDNGGHNLVLATVPQRLFLCFFLWLQKKGTIRATVPQLSFV